MNIFPLFFSMLFASSCLAVKHGDVLPPSHPPVGGSIVRTLQYADCTGENILVLTETDIKQSKKDGDDNAVLQSKCLHAYAFSKNGMKQIWKVSDGVKDCPAITSIGAMHQPDSVKITDLDGDGLAEVWLAYEMWCKGDVSPSKLKVIMYEGSRKHAIRGETFLHIDGNDMGGEGIMDAAFSEAEESIRSYAKAYWKKVSHGGKAR